MIFSNLNSNKLGLRNLQEQVKKAFCYQKLFWPFTVWIDCSSDLKKFPNSWPSASNFKSFSRSLKHFFLTVGQNNFGNKIPFHFLVLIKGYFLSFLKKEAKVIVIEMSDFVWVPQMQRFATMATFKPCEYQEIIQL